MSINKRISLLCLIIRVPENILDLRYDDEIKVICELYLDFREKITNTESTNWASGANGFRYHRNQNETLIFDKNCKLIERVY